MAKFKAPTTEADFIARCNRIRDMEREGNRQNAISAGTDNLADRITNNDPIPLFIVEGVADLYPAGKDRPNLLQLIVDRDHAALVRLSREASRKASAAWDALEEEWESKLLKKFHPTTIEGKLAALDVCFETIAKYDADDWTGDASEIARGLMAEIRDAIPEIICNKDRRKAA